MGGWDECDCLVCLSHTQSLTHSLKTHTHKHTLTHLTTHTPLPLPLQDWASSEAPPHPNIPPQSHVVNARTNPDW